ncbi:hypothetical protein C8Q75DRAFT_109562 [Abortiporus biennis]|nr:hypothetical protein C8Q75DRAFT_109562 [Abortiporus biennis]
MADSYSDIPLVSSSGPVVFRQILTPSFSSDVLEGGEPRNSQTGGNSDNTLPIESSRITNTAGTSRPDQLSSYIVSGHPRPWPLYRPANPLMKVLPNIGWKNRRVFVKSFDDHFSLSILLCIMKSLRQNEDFETLLNCALVSKRWYRAAMLQLMYNVVLKTPASLHKLRQTSFRMWSLGCDRFQIVDLELKETGYSQNWPNDTIHIWGKLLSQYLPSHPPRTICFRNFGRTQKFSWGLLYTILARMPCKKRPKTLVISGCDFSSSSELLGFVKSGFPGVRSLVLHGVSLNETEIQGICSSPMVHSSSIDIDMLRIGPLCDIQSIERWTLAPRSANTTPILKLSGLEFDRFSTANASDISDTCHSIHIIWRMRERLKYLSIGCVFDMTPDLFNGVISRFPSPDNIIQALFYLNHFPELQIFRLRLYNALHRDIKWLPRLLRQLFPPKITPKTPYLRSQNQTQPFALPNLTTFVLEIPLMNTCQLEQAVVWEEVADAFKIFSSMDTPRRIVFIPTGTVDFEEGKCALFRRFGSLEEFGLEIIVQRYWETPSFD